MQQHCDEEDLVLLVLGEPVPTEVTEHLATCELCAAEHEAFTAVVATARAAEDDELVTPPASVWEGIATELELANTAVPTRGGERFHFPAPPVDDEVLRSDAEAPGRPAPASSSADAASGGAEVVDLSSRRSPQRWSWIAGAAAVGVIVGGVGGSWIASRSPAEPQPTVVAQAPLDPLPGWDGASGEAVVHTAADGTRTLVLDVEATVPDDGFREVWLIDRDVTRLVSIGVLEGSSGTFVLPSGIDLEDFAVVDVSQEHFDGDPAHSGDSIVRGILET